MKTDSGRYQLVYDYYETRILYGFYIRGEHLPSILKICAIFQLAPATVRSRAEAAGKRGYIKVAARKAAEVVYKARPGQFRKNAAEYFVPRKEGIIDLFQSGETAIRASLENRDTAMECRRLGRCSPNPEGNVRRFCRPAG